jgi:hypothetical protein
MPSAAGATHAGSRRWCPEVPAQVACPCSAATCAPLLAACTEAEGPRKTTPTATAVMLANLQNYEYWVHALV